MGGTCRGEACLSRCPVFIPALLQPFSFKPRQRRILHVDEQPLPPGWIIPVRRKSPRLASYDYSQPGVYFVTLCTHNSSCLFADVVGRDSIPGDVGRIVETCWVDIPRHFPDVELDLYIVMPNHFHGLIRLTGAADRPADGRACPTVHTVIGAFKSAATRQVNAMRSTPGVPLWQRTYYEHVIRTELGLDRIREYIANNPAKWDLDEENPAKRQHRREQAGRAFRRTGGPP